MTAPRVIIRVRPRMGTVLALTIHGPRPHAEQAARRAFALVARLERLMSGFLPESALSRINRAAERPVIVPAELARALRDARRLAGLTGGGFDPTIAPLAALWREAATRGAPPSPAALRRGRARVGWRALILSGRRVRLGQAGMALDLGGIAKGWAADRLGEAIARWRGLSALVNFGESTLLAVGHGSWPVLLRHPIRGVAGWFPLSRGACSTSASLGRVWRVGRRTVGHVIDPRSGRPLTRPAQVTVLAPSAAGAEAASTALLVLGRGALRGVSRRLGVEACWLDAEGVTATEGFRLYPWHRGRQR